MKFFRAVTCLIVLFSMANSLAKMTVRSHFKQLQTAALSSLNEQIFSQQVDHKGTRPGTFKQRYWHNDSYAADQDALVILSICGEDTCSDPMEADAANILSSQAAMLGAHVFALEHRYYGKSFPVPDLKTANMKFLTIEQALLDLVNFKRQMQKKLALTGKWIVVGGSYPGMLAALLRSKFPKDFVGALASSAPMKLETDYSEYDAHVAKVVGATCLGAIQKVVDDVELAIESPNAFIQLKNMFSASKLKDKDDFLYLLADTAALSVQYGMHKRFCNLVLTQGKNGYARGVEMINRELGISLQDLSAQVSMDPTLATGAKSGMRQWLYQTCTELGLWQNANPNPAMRARSLRIDSEYHHNICMRLFSLPAASAEETNKKYYEPFMRSGVSNILFTNGDLDPWMNLSIVRTQNTRISTVIIKGGAHCDDLFTSTNPSVNQAQALFMKLAPKWIY